MNTDTDIPKDIQLWLAKVDEIIARLKNNENLSASEIKEDIESLIINNGEHAENILKLLKIDLDDILSIIQEDQTQQSLSSNKIKIINEIWQWINNKLKILETTIIEPPSIENLIKTKMGKAQAASPLGEQYLRALGLPVTATEKQEYDLNKLKIQQLRKPEAIGYTDSNSKSAAKNKKKKLDSCLTQEQTSILFLQLKECKLISPNVDKAVIGRAIGLLTTLSETQARQISSTPDKDRKKADFEVLISAIELLLSRLKDTVKDNWG